MIVYTLGYATWSIDAVDKQLTTLDAVLIDVRQSPHTTKPGFAKSDLDTRFGPRYVHLPAFGNVNYKEGPIELANPDRGLEAIQSLDRDPVLMCGCRPPAPCHRSTAARLIADRFDATITHLRSPSEHTQPGLFEAPDA